MEGYDGVYLVPTSRGKSLLVEGVAAMVPDKIVVAIEPLKLLEWDQVCAILINL